MSTRDLVSSIDIENRNPNIVAPSPAKSPRRKNFYKKQQYKATKAVPTALSVTATPAKDYEISTSVPSIAQTPQTLYEVEVAAAATTIPPNEQDVAVWNGF